jgi:hypothetical protein
MTSLNARRSLKLRRCDASSRWLSRKRSATPPETNATTINVPEFTRIVSTSRATVASAGASKARTGTRVRMSTSVA